MLPPPEINKLKNVFNYRTETSMFYDETNQLTNIDRKNERYIDVYTKNLLRGITYITEEHGNFYTNYTYNDNGFIRMSRVEHSKGQSSTIYSYNNKNVLSKKTDLHMIDRDIYAIDYKYDYKLIKVPSKFRYSEEKSESLQYTFDDKKNPRYYIIPEKLALINPIYLNKNNILEIKDLEGKIIKTYTNTYNSDGYLTKSIEKNANNEKTKIVEYIY